MNNINILYEYIKMSLVEDIPDKKDECYILTIYKITLDDENIKNNKVHIVGHFKKDDDKKMTLLNDKEIYHYLKYQKQVCIKSVIGERVKMLCDEIHIKGGWEKYRVTEIYRYICSSVEQARNLINKQSQIVRTYCSESKNRFECYSCKYTTNQECYWLRHQTCKTHLDRTNINSNKISYTCPTCSCSFLSRITFWRHKKNCVNEQSKSYVLRHFIEVDKPYIGMQNEVMEIIQQNQVLIAQNEEFKELLMEQHDKMMELSMIPRHTTTINNNNNSNNHFNLNFFLNETCKDAMSLSQFVNSLQIDTATLEYTGVNGYVAGISKIFTDGLRQLEMTMRPIHCTDLKRETLYIKENDVWEKDTDEKTKFNNALKAVVRRNMQQVREWVDMNPRCDIIDSREYQLHIDIMKQCVGGNCEYTNNRKILRNVAKEVFIDKTKM